MAERGSSMLTRGGIGSVGDSVGARDVQPNRNGVAFKLGIDDGKGVGGSVGPGDGDGNGYSSEEYGCIVNRSSQE